METQHKISCAENEYIPDMCTSECWQYWACKARYEQTQKRIADNLKEFYNYYKCGQERMRRDWSVFVLRWLIPI